MKRPLRLMQIQRLIYKNPKGLTSQELATLCKVHVRTIQRDLLDLQTDFRIPITQDGDRYSVLVGYDLPPISFSLFEGMALFLACRLAMRQSGQSNPHMDQALAKMADVLPAALVENLKVGTETNPTDEAKEALSHVFEYMTTALMNQRQARIRIVSLRDGQIKEWLFEPYFMEMAGVGHSIYVIGRGLRDRDGIDHIISVKLTRVRSIEVLNKTFEAPSASDLRALLASTWNIMWEEESETRLWFSHRDSYAEEGSLYPCQVTDPSGDGHLMTLHVSGWLEAHPSITYYTGRVGLLSPASLRRHFADFAEKLWQTSPALAKVLPDILEQTHEEERDLVIKV